jgi:hypothetical protein
MASRLEATLSLAMLVFFVSLLAGWSTGARLSAIPLLVLACVFAARVIARRARGASWDEAWGRSSH